MVMKTCSTVCFNSCYVFDFMFLLYVMLAYIIVFFCFYHTHLLHNTLKNK